MFKNGFIYPVINFLVKILFYLNLVVWFKKLSRYIGIRISGDNSEQNLIFYSNIGIDIYQIFKWGTLLLFWTQGYQNEFSKLFIMYLIFSNLFIYTYYHVWGSNYIQRTDKDALNRKFINYLLAIMFYLACYAYLYEVHYSVMIEWPDKNTVNTFNALYISVSNAFTLIYSDFKPLSPEVRALFLSEMINTFLFFTIIISNSIPKHEKPNS